MRIDHSDNGPGALSQADARDQEDMARIVAGHSEALDDLMIRQAPKLLQYLIRSLQDEADAADLAQESFVRVYQHRAKFNPSQRFSTWLYAIASNLVRDRYRHRSRHPQVRLDGEKNAANESFLESLEEPRPTPADGMEAEERFATIRSAVQALPEDLRLALILFEYEELSQAEIAEVLDCSPKAVETRLYRARRQLRERLGRLLDRRH